MLQQWQLLKAHTRIDHMKEESTERMGKRNTKKSYGMLEKCKQFK